jgi:hypothetical protein
MEAAGSHTDPHAEYVPFLCTGALAFVERHHYHHSFTVFTRMRFYGGRGRVDDKSAQGLSWS